jgi:predicted dinucleotide-binding enzyme
MGETLGPSVVAHCVAHASAAEIIFLAVSFSAHKDVANRFKNWNEEVVVDVTNALRAAQKS